MVVEQSRKPETISLYVMYNCERRLDEEYLFKTCSLFRLQEMPFSIRINEELENLYGTRLSRV